jgi:hypothetical protein
MLKKIQLKASEMDKKMAIIFAISISVVSIIAVTQDVLRSSFQNSNYYFSESFLFSSFWWLFAPLYFAQYLFVKNSKNHERLTFQFTIIVLPILVHLIAFPAFVWLISCLFYDNTFAFLQTFKYTFSELFYLLIIFYTIPVFAFIYYFKNLKLDKEIVKVSEKQYITSILVSDVSNKTSINVAEILYLSANSPYINIQMEGKKYILNQTLKSILTKLNPEQFVRIHKSIIVNINMVESYTSKFNGDYVLTLKNKIQIRASRNFATDFKGLYNKTHQVTVF